MLQIQVVLVKLVIEDVKSGMRITQIIPAAECNLNTYSTQFREKIINRIEAHYLGCKVVDFHVADAYQFTDPIEPSSIHLVNL